MLKTLNPAKNAWKQEKENKANGKDDSWSMEEESRRKKFAGNQNI